MALSSVGVCYRIDDALRLLVSELLIVVNDIPEMVPTAVMSFADAHRVVRKVNIAVIAKEFRHFESLSSVSGV